MIKLNRVFYSEEKMKIIVCIKQVPDTADIKWSENNTIIREGVESILNPFDAYALEAALKIKDKDPQTQITVLTMGPPQAKEILKRAIATGADEGILLSDKKFAGADTQATSKTLAAAIKNKIGDFDLIFCGQFAIDGDTAQTGPSIAQHLNLPQVTYAREIIELHDKNLVLEKETEYGTEKLRLKLPAVVCMIKNDKKPRKFTIEGSIKAQNTDITTCSMEEIGLTPQEVGILGSPTYVSKAFRPQRQKECQMIDFSDYQECAEQLLEKLKDIKIIGEDR